MGGVGPEQVASAFYSFSPRMVADYVEPAWRIASPAAVIEARTRAVDRAYRGLFGDRVTGPELAEAAALDWPRAPHLQLWHAATILREHRGDGHLAALLTAGLDPVESLVSFAAIGAASAERFESRGWSPQEWAAARGRLAARGLVGADGAATETGRALRRSVERDTDQLAAGPWQSLGPAGTDRLAELLGDFWVAVLASGLLPSETTLGIGKV